MPRLILALLLAIAPLLPCQDQEIPADTDAALAESDIAEARKDLAAIAAELTPLSRAMNLIHRITAPSVVSINLTLQKFDPFARRGRIKEVKVGEGSGFVVSSDDTFSWILTNAHVILQQGRNQEFLRDYRGRVVPFDSIRIETHDGNLLEAAFIGADVKSDLAVLRVDLPHMPVVEWADSDEVMVGDHVMALGYPLGIGYSASAGIISATDRSTGVYRVEDGFESFLQTDAAINPGNSGGPLLDLEGQVIGVNANLVSPNTGSNIGLGFAIPANLAKRVSEDLIRYGSVNRPAIGVAYDQLTPEEAASRDIPNPHAVSLALVMPRTPADEAGLQTGDLIIGLDGRAITGLADLRARIAATPVGNPLDLQIWRDGEAMTITVLCISDEELRQRLRDQDPETLAAAMFDRRYGLGFDVDDDGLVVTEVDPEGPAAAILQPGDRIVAVRGAGPVRSLATLNQLLHTFRSLVLHVYRDGRTLAIRLTR